MLLGAQTAFCDTGEFVLIYRRLFPGAQCTGIRGIDGAFADGSGTRSSPLVRPTEICPGIYCVNPRTQYPWNEEGARVGCAVSLCGMGSASDALLRRPRRLRANDVPLNMPSIIGPEDVRAFQELMTALGRSSGWSGMGYWTTAPRSCTQTF